MVSFQRQKDLSDVLKPKDSGLTPKIVPTPSPNLPRGTQITNNLAGNIKDTNLRNLEGIETVKVTNMTSVPALPKTFGSFFNTVNKTVSSAFNQIMSFQQQPQQDFSTGLKPEHAQAQQGMPGAGRVGGQPPAGSHPGQQAPHPGGMMSHPGGVHPHHPGAHHPGGAPGMPPVLPNVTGGVARPQVTPAQHATSQAPGPRQAAVSPAFPPRSPSAMRSRSPSPRRAATDVGFSAAVSNLCDQAHSIAERDRRGGGSFRRKGTYYYSITTTILYLYYSSYTYNNSLLTCTTSSLTCTTHVIYVYY